MLKRILLLALAIFILNSCSVSPSGRTQFIMVNEAQMAQMGAQSYQKIKRQQQVSKDQRANAYVNCIANHIIAELDGANQSNWEVNVFNNKSANAFALPGKKIGVNTGMLRTARTQHQLAAVMGHEVGHVLARHGSERVSLQMATNTGAQLINAFLNGKVSAENTKMAMAALGLGAKFGITLPFSREHETEADLIGLKLMAKAGFNPQGSVQLWQNMSASSNQAPPEFMSTHPAHSTRISNLKANMPEAMRIYRNAQSQGKNPNCG